MKVFWNGQKRFLWSEEGICGVGIITGKSETFCVAGETQWARPGGLWDTAAVRTRRPPAWPEWCAWERRRLKPNVGDPWQVVCDASCSLAQGRGVARGGVVMGLEGGAGAHPSTSTPLSSRFQFCSNQHSVFFDLKTPSDEPAWSLYKAAVLKLGCACLFRDLILNGDSWDLSYHTPKFWFRRIVLEELGSCICRKPGCSIDHTLQILP